MNELQFRGKLCQNVFLLSTIGNENSVCVGHILEDNLFLLGNDNEPHSTKNIFREGSISSDDGVEPMQFFASKRQYLPFFKDYKAPFKKRLVLRPFSKNGNVQEIIDRNPDLEELYIRLMIKQVLRVLVEVHKKGLSGLGIGPLEIEVGDCGSLCFPFYYGVRRLRVSLLMDELKNLQNLTSLLIQSPKFAFGDISKTRFSNRFKDFLMSLFQNFRFQPGSQMVSERSGVLEYCH